MDLEQHLKRQIAFSRATFGPGERREGVADHIRKEIDKEILRDDVDAVEAADEWVDVVILALDGLTRALAASGVAWRHIPVCACQVIEAKQSKNEQRDWPDWRTADPNKAIEHNRDGDRMRKDCEILLAQIDYLTEATGESLGIEDAAMVEQIRADLAKSGKPGELPE